MRLHKHKPTNRRRHAAARTYGWATFLSWFVDPEDAEDAPGSLATGSEPLAAVGPLPTLPPGAMSQRTKELPKLPARTAFPADVREAARRVAVAAYPPPAYEIDQSAPMFRDEETEDQYEARRLARLHRIQRIRRPWPDGQGVSMGWDQSPKTITWSTADYREFAENQSPTAGSR